LTFDQLYGLGKVIEDPISGKVKKISFREKTVENILKGIASSRQVPFERVLFALGIRYVGETVARKLALHFKNIDAIRNARYDELTQVPEIGEIIARSVIDWFSDADNQMLVERLRKHGVRMQVEESGQVQVRMSNVLAGKTFVITGSYATPERRKELEALVEAHGGRLADSVSSKTNYIVAGENPGPSKIQKARQLGIPVITEDEFLQMIS